MGDFDAQLPVRTIATEFTTEVANSTGTTINPAEDYAQGSTTSGQNGILTLGAVTTASPTYTTGTSNPLSLDTSGNLRVTIGSGSTSVTQGTTPWVDDITQWANTTLGAPSAYGTSPGAVTVPGVNAFVTNTVAENLTQVGGSAITLGQKTSANSVPVVIASDQSPINVQIGGVTPVVTYATTASVASNASATQSVAGPINLDAVHATASGELKVVIAIGITGSEVTKWVGFTTASSKNFDWVLPDTYNIPTGSSVKITITNYDKQAMDIYSSVINH